MPHRTVDLQQTFPARQLRSDERELVAEWLAAADDVSSAFVSERRSDDPAIYRRIAISLDGNGVFTHLIHTPAHNDIWIVLNVRHKPEVHQFDSLLEALNFVRPVLRWSNAWPGGDSADHNHRQQQCLPAAHETSGQGMAGQGMERRGRGPEISIPAACKTAT